MNFDYSQPVPTAPKFDRTPHGAPFSYRPVLNDTLPQSSATPVPLFAEVRQVQRCLRQKMLLQLNVSSSQPLSGSFNFESPNEKRMRLATVDAFNQPPTSSNDETLEYVRK